MARVSISARVDFSHLDRVGRMVDGLADSFAYNLATYQEVHHRQEAPLGREFYTDEQGNEHPGWLRDSVDSLPLPGPGHMHLVTVHADYGIYVNNGTRYMPANPFWERATLRTEQEADDLLDRVTRQQFASIGLPVSGVRVLR